MDLSLVPINDLIDEAISRCDCFVAAYTMTADPISPEVFVSYSSGTHTERLGLCRLLDNALIEYYMECNKEEN